MMKQPEWTSFLTERLKSQIALENSELLQKWALALLGLAFLGFGFKAVADAPNPATVFAVKVLFICIFHAVMALGFYLPSLLEKGEKVQTRVLGVRDFSGLTRAALVFGFYAVVLVMVASQAFEQTGKANVSGYFSFITAANWALALGYAGLCSFLALSFVAFPSALIKFAEKCRLFPVVLFWVHAAFFFLTAAAYSELAPLGSGKFFEHLLIAGQFWVFILASVFFMAGMGNESQISSLRSLEFEVVSGRLDRPEDILTRYKEVFVRKRLAYWINSLSHVVAARAHEIAAYTHEAVRLVDRENPTEVDLQQVDSRYKKADSLHRRFDRESQRFLLSLALFDFNESERERIESLRDQFSRVLRNTKLELASVRKRIDDKLVSIKNSQISFLPTAALPAKEPPQVPLSH